jgi:hypothetical protein
MRCSRRLAPSRAESACERARRRSLWAARDGHEKQRPSGAVLVDRRPSETLLSRGAGTEHDETRCPITRTTIPRRVCRTPSSAAPWLIRQGSTRRSSRTAPVRHFDAGRSRLRELRAGRSAQAGSRSPIQRSARACGSRPSSARRCRPSLPQQLEREQRRADANHDATAPAAPRMRLLLPIVGIQLHGIAVKQRVRDDRVLVRDHD